MFGRLTLVLVALASLALAAPMLNQMSDPRLKENRYGIYDFPCKVNQTLTPATSVHNLRPEDVKVLGALGDSITAAFGAASTSLINLAVEWRGLSWSIGGDNTFEESLTLGNIIKKYNPSVRGLSLGTGSRNQNLNVAVSGAIARDMPGQAVNLINAMRSDPLINFNNDWKVVTIWIGGNDFCSVCEGRPENQPEGYAQYIEQTLDILDAQVPRLFVNLVQVIDVTTLYPVQEGTCVFYHRLLCPCGTNDDASVRNSVSAATKDVHARLDRLVTQAKYNDRDDFTVVIQPFFIETSVPLRDDGTPDRSWFAPDCFHFTVKGHEAAAVALFNNMLEPIGQKSRKWNPGENIKCTSSSSPYFRTSKN